MRGSLINRRYRRALSSLTTLLLVLICQLGSLAGVTRIEITSREPFADGMSFGQTGPYEKIKGFLHYAVDPALACNRRIVDIDLAPVNGDGKVEFKGEFLLLKPVDLSKGNHRLLYDVNNRGNLVMLGSFNNPTARGNDPSAAEHAGNGFLMRQGYSLLWTAWNWDVTEGGGRLQIELPVATENGKPIRQKIAAEIVTSFTTDIVYSQPLAWGSSRCYVPVDPEDPEAELTVRDEPRGKRRVIPREDWSYAHVEDGTVIPDLHSLYVRTGMEPGRIYELIYEVENPRVAGLGLASVRDAISFFHFSTADTAGTPNPLTRVEDSGATTPDPDYAYIYGVSQSGRFITHMIWEGFHVDEQSRLVFEGARIHVPGGGKGGFNHRFAQTTHHPSDLEGNYMPADFYPFNYLPDGMEESEEFGDVLKTAKRLGQIPFIIITNNELEYWTRSASLIHTDVYGKVDAPVHEKVRIYVTNGAPHRGIRSRERGIYEHSLNTISVEPVLRATLVALDNWVSKGTEPPASRYPRIDRGELIPAAQHKAGFPSIPGMRHPGRNLQPPRVDYGPRFWTEGIMDIVPPEMGAAYNTLVPNYDSDGNSIGGIRLPELAVPLGTYQGWNVRRVEFNAPQYLGRFEGSFWQFPLTEEEQKATGDARASIDSRYKNKEDYIGRISRAVDELVSDGFLLREDADAYVVAAGKLSWPVEQLETKPFWKMR